MKNKIDFAIAWSLLKKQTNEKISSFKKGNRDLVGVCLRIVLIAALVWVFVAFFGKFLDVYLAIKTNRLPDVQTRLFEIMCFAYAAILLFMTIGAVQQISKSIFNADDMKIFSAMPISAKTIYVAKLFTIYISQLFISIIATLSVNITVALHSTQGAWFYGFSVVLCFVLPLVSIAIAALLALPYHAIRQYLKSRFVLNFVVVTLIAVGLLYLYSFLLNGVKELLLGDHLKYFFNEKVMTVLHKTAMWLYPAKWLSDFMLKQNVLVSGLGVLAVLLVSLSLSLLVIKKILDWSLQSRIAGEPNFVKKPRQIAKKSSVFGGLMKKEFLQIFRTPNYTFSYFSVMIMMPMLVYFCLSVGSSLVVKLIGINCDFEMAIFLTLLFSTLTNIFCSTNISRDGAMFYSIKAMPIDYKDVFYSKITLCIIVSSLSQAISALLLGVTGFLTVLQALFLFGVGLVMAFAQICFATRFDFNHAKFSTEDDGEVGETSSSVSIMVVLGMAISFVLGAILVGVKMYCTLKKQALFGFSYIFTSCLAIALAVLSFVYLTKNLKRKYYEFSGGGLL